MKIEIGAEFGYVILVIACSHIMNMFLMVQVGMARKKYNVQYPALYADESNKNAKEFNCVQRAHQNTLENLAMIQILMILNGLVYPVYTAGFGFIFVIGRVLYGYGYANYGPSGRMVGGLISHLGDFPLMIMTFYTGWQMVKSI